NFEESSDLDFADMSEPETQMPEPSTTEVLAKTPLQKPKEEIRKTSVEDFSDLKSFANTTTYTNLAAEGNPPFSVIIKDLHYLEDINEIINELISFKLISTEEKEKAQESFMRGS